MTRGSGVVAIGAHASAVSATIAEHVAAIGGASLPAEVLHAAARSVLDAIGVSLGASGVGEGCAAFIELAASVGGSGPCQVLGTELVVSPTSAALANGALAHALDFEDAHDLALVHPNAAPVAAALALAELLGSGAGPTSAASISGRRFLASVAAGADLVCRLGFLLTRVADERGWYPPPIFGAIGAAATAANLLGLGPAGVLDSVSLVTCQSSCLGELKRSPASLVRAVRDAFGAEGAVTSALLAAAGVTGYDRPFEGEAGVVVMYGDGRLDPGALLEGLGTTFHGADVSYKPWPSCRGTHAFVDAALTLRDVLNGEKIVSVRLRGGSVNRMLAEPRPQKLAPQTAIDAKFSLPFTVATALVRGGLGLDDFDEAARTDPAVLGVGRLVSFEVEDRRSGADWGQVTIELASGRTISQLVEDLPGSPARPLDDAALVDKFVRCAAVALVPLEAGTARAYAERILGLAEAPNAAVALRRPDRDPD